MRAYSRIGLPAVLAVVALVPLSASAQITSREVIPQLVQASHDDCASPLSYHASQVEPSIATHGSTVVASFQVGRVYDGGACDIGWATSGDGGRTWQHGLLPLTIYGGQQTTDAGPLSRASDPSVAYDEQDGVWLIDTLGLSGNANVPGVFVNRSTDGLTWGPPIATHVAGGDSPDKNWITCDNWATSAGYGNCYEEYDDSNAGDQIKMQRSTDGGLTWSAPVNLANGQTGGIGGGPGRPAASSKRAGRHLRPRRRPDPGERDGLVHVVGLRRVLVGADADHAEHDRRAPRGRRSAHVARCRPRRSTARARSTRSGRRAASARRTRPSPLRGPPGDTCVRLVSITGLAAAQTLRIDPRGPHPEVVTIQTVGSTACNGASGATITPALAYAHAVGAFVTKNNVASNSSADPNDIAMAVMPAPTDANPNPVFGAPVRIPIEADSGGQSNTNDHFIPGIAADSATSGSTAHLGLFYYTYRVAACQAYVQTNLCLARVGYVSSVDGGATWTRPQSFGAMSMAEIPRSSQGPMVGDYATAEVVSAGDCQGHAIETFALGLPPEPADNALYEAMYTPPCGLLIGKIPAYGPLNHVTSSTSLVNRAPVTRAQIHAFRTAH